LNKLKFSYFQLTFGQEEAYLHPEKTYQRLQHCGYDAIEVTPPKGRYGLGVKMEHYLRTHKQLMADYGLCNEPRKLDRFSTTLTVKLGQSKCCR
jgi:hypothetical protein